MVGRVLKGCGDEKTRLDVVVGIDDEDRDVVEVDVCSTNRVVSPFWVRYFCLLNRASHLIKMNGRNYRLP